MQIKTLEMIDFGKATPAERKAFGDQLVDCAKTMGFLILKNTAISLERQNQMFELSKFFFENLTPEIRKEVAWSPKYNYGLAGIGAESLDENAFDIKETYNVGLEGATNPNKLSKDPKLATFNKELLKYGEECYTVIKDLMRAFALGCDLEQEFFVNMHDYNSQTMRLLHFPHIEGTVGEYFVSPHTDYGTLTLVYSDGPGFSVKDTKDGQWYDVFAEPGCAIINISDLLSRWTNDELQSNPHRVKFASIGKSRFMTAYFAYPSHDKTIECLPKFVGKGAKYAPINAYDYLQSRLSQTYKQAYDAAQK